MSLCGECYFNSTFKANALCIWSILDYWTYEVSHNSPQIDGKKNWKVDVSIDPVTTSGM